MSKKPQKTKQKISKEHVKAHSHFILIIVLIAAFSLFALINFWGSTSDYLRYASVVSYDDEEELEDEEEYEIEKETKILKTSDTNENAKIVKTPAACISCPPFPICADACPVDEQSKTVEEKPYPVFSDLMSDQPNAKSVEKLLFSGIIKGYSDGSFKPDSTINRAEMLTIITTAVKADFGGKYYGNCFQDVKDEWFSPFVCYGKLKGWVKGYSQDNTYRPGQPITKAEALKIVMTSLGIKVDQDAVDSLFKDVQVTDWYAPYANKAYGIRMIPVSGDFDANHLITRAEFADMVYQGMKYKELID